jgi:hypothetical protein
MIIMMMSYHYVVSLLVLIVVSTRVEWVTISVGMTRGKIERRVNEFCKNRKPYILQYTHYQSLGKWPLCL